MMLLALDGGAVAHLAVFAGSACWRPMCGRLNVAEPDGAGAWREAPARHSWERAGGHVVHILSMHDPDMALPVCRHCLARHARQTRQLAEYVARVGPAE